MNAKILIFVSRTGGGHVSLAEALRDLLGPGCTVELFDPQPRIVHEHYRLVSRHALWLWELEYKSSDDPARSQAAHRLFTALMERRVASALNAFQPDLIITTYPFLTCEIMATLHRLQMKTPFVMLQADPNGVHQSWLTEQGAQAVFCPTREDFIQTLQAGFPARRVHLSGWPVRSQFLTAQQSSERDLLVKMGLQPGRFTLFLQGGGEGAARFVRTVQSLLAIEDIQLILAAGTNKHLLTHFQNSSRLHVLPFTRQIAPYMAAADVVMGKAGPNMLFESVTLGKPFIATAYIPGQEQPNLEFIERYGLGWVALKTGAQRRLVADLASSPGRLEEMKGRVAAYRAWNCNRLKTIPPVVEGLLKT